MDFELTNVRESPETHKRLRIDKIFNAYPEIKIATLDKLYEGYDAVVFRRVRDRSFGLIADRQLDCHHHRRFIQNATFIADVLEVKFPREIEIDCGFTQYVNISAVQMHATISKTDERQVPTNTRKDCLEVLDKIYDRAQVSKNVQTYSLMEQMISELPLFLKDKNPRYHILASDGYGFVINYRAEKANGTELLTYCLAYNLKRGGRRRAAD